MTQREFERKIKKLVPSVKYITYGKNFDGKNFILTDIFVHTNPVNLTQKSCYLKTGKDCLEKMIKMFEVKNESTS